MKKPLKLKKHKVRLLLVILKRGYAIVTALAFHNFKVLRNFFLNFLDLANFVSFSVFWGTGSGFLRWGHLCCYHVVQEIIRFVSTSLASSFLWLVFLCWWAFFFFSWSDCGVSSSLAPAICRSSSSLPPSSCCCSLSSTSDCERYVLPSIHCFSSCLWVSSGVLPLIIFSASSVLGLSALLFYFDRTFPPFSSDWSLRFVLVVDQYFSYSVNQTHFSLLPFLCVLPISSVLAFYSFYPSWTTWCVLLSHVPFWDCCRLRTSYWKQCFYVIALLEQYSFSFLIRSLEFWSFCAFSHKNCWVLAGFKTFFREAEFYVSWNRPRVISF